MADVRPFRGFRYNPSVVGDPSDLVCPPYDIISPPEEQDLLRHSPYNAVRLELREHQPGEPADEPRYARAAATFRRWVDDGVLVRDGSPTMYLVEGEFAYRGASRRRRGLMTVVRLEPFERGIVMPHEYTRPGPKLDRLALMREAHTNFSPIMSLYRDPDGVIAGLLERTRQNRPDVTAAFGDQSHYNMWAIADVDLLSRISQAMAPLQVFVADGHHRYETALQYRDELEAVEGPLPPNAAARFMMMELIAMEDQGLLVLPYHRLVSGLSQEEIGSLRRRLEQFFQTEPIELDRGSAEAMAASMERALAQRPKDEVAVAALGLEGGRAHLLTLRQDLSPGHDAPSLERCDVWVLHQKALRPALGEEGEGAAVAFVHDSVEAVERVLTGEAQVALLLRPLPMDLFREVVGKGERLPPKSTYFYPKLPTGLVVNLLEGEL